jgi:hypothetical protein
MFVGKKPVNQRTNFLESLREGLKEQEEESYDSRIENWQEKNKIITEREEYVEHMKTVVEDWNGQIDQLEDKARNSGAEVRVKAEALIGELDQKLAEGQESLMNIAGTTDDTWINLKSKAEVLWEDIKNKVNETREALS